MRRDIYVHPSIDALDSKLKDALERLAPVRFNSCCDIAERRRGDAVLSLSGQADALSALSKSHVVYFHTTELTVPARSEQQTEIVHFSDSARLETLLRNRRLPQRKLEDFAPVAVQEGDELLAEYGGQEIWTARPSEQGVSHIVSAPVPRFAADEHALDYLNGYDFILLLPLLHFLREVSAEFAWVRPKLRACLTFDDPNLHWPTYGCLSYRELVERARRDRFHVTIATVPLDAWAAHPGAASLFRDNPKQLSLAVHGNNHTREEYGRLRSPEAQLALVAQSLKRIERLELATGLGVDRAIVPPHEALTEASAAAMFALGLEGASLSSWSLRHWNQDKQWPASFGVEMAEMSAEGFPCIDRYRLTEDCEGPAVISSFLGKPVVFAEHHKAVARGHEVLSAAASVINSLGDVAWGGIEALLSSNYLQRKEGGSLRVKPYSSRIRLFVPDDVDTVHLDLESAELRSTQYRLLNPSHKDSRGEIAPARSFEVTPGEHVELVSQRLGAARSGRLEVPALSFAALSRRFFCEARDRWAGFRAGVQIPRRV